MLVGPWPPSRPSSSHLFCAQVSSSLWHPSSSGPPSRRPSTLTLVFLHSYFLLACSDITSLPPFPHSSSPHVPAVSIFLFLFLLLCPILHIIASLLHLFCSSSILLHIVDQIFFSAPSFPKYANFSHNLPLSTTLHSHTAPLVLLLFCTFLFLLSWIWLLISTGAILSNNSYFRPLFLLLSLCFSKWLHNLY